MKKTLGLVITLTVICFSNFTLTAQSISFGPSIPAATAETVTTCSGQSQYSVEFSNGATQLSNVGIEVQLNAGVEYIPGSFTFTSSGSAAVVEASMTDLNRPKFKIETLDAGEEIILNIDRKGSCEARDLKINGNTFSDSTFIFEGLTEVTYANGVGSGVATYDVIYASLSIVNVVTNPSPVNVMGTASRSMDITNGSFGSIDSFTYVEVFPDTALIFSNFQINGTYAIPAANITVTQDSLIIGFSSAEIMAINGASGDGDAQFELDEQFELSYDMTAENCGVGNNINSDLSVFWGCGNTTCQTGTNTSSLAIVNASPVLSISNVSKPNLDFCQTVTYSLKLTNTSPVTNPVGGSFAKDVIIFIGLRQNHDPVATLANMTMDSPDMNNTKLFTDYTLNGVTVALPKVLDVNGDSVSYVPANFFEVDPDGPGGLTDIDGDGYFDDLPKDSSIVVSFNVTTNPRTGTCGLGRYDYMQWEHIAADINWSNQCGNLMTPIRQEFNYVNMIRDYLYTTLTDSPTDLIDTQLFEASIKPHLLNSLNCNGGNGLTGTDVNWIVRAILPPGIIVDPAYDNSKFTVSGDTIFTSGAYKFDYTDFPLKADCSSWNNINPVQINFQTVYECNSGGANCLTRDVHCLNVPIILHCGTGCAGVVPLSFSTLRTSESWTDNTKSTLVNIEDPDIERNVVYPGDTILFSSHAVFSDSMSDNLYLRITYQLDDDANAFDYQEGSITIIDIDGEFNGGQTEYTFPLNTAPTVNKLGTGSYELIYDLSEFQDSIDVSYMYGKNIAGPPNYDKDSIFLESYFTLNSTMTGTEFHIVNNFRSEFFIMDGLDEKSCSSWGSNLAYNKVTYSYSSYNNFINGCNSFAQNFYFTHRSATGDDHPDEYRPTSHVDSFHLTLPSGLIIDSIQFIDDATMLTSDYSFDGTNLKVYRPANYKELDKRKTYYPNITLYLTPTCEMSEGTSAVNGTVYFRDWAYLVDPSLYENKSITMSTTSLEYTAPNFTLIPNETSKEIAADQTSWIVNLCNATSSSDIDYNWIILESLTGGISVDSVQDISSGTAVTLPLTTRVDGSTYFELGGLPIAECSVFEIFGTLKSCVEETLDIRHGWGCSGYQDPNTALTCQESTAVLVKTKEPQISTNISTLFSTPIDPSNPAGGNWNSNSVDMCEDFPTEIRVVNAQPGNLYNTLLDISIPSSGSGLSYVAGSMTIEVEGVDVVNTPRAIGAAAEAALVAASSGGATNWVVTLAELDPTNFGSDEPLNGTDNISQNEFVVRWLSETTCDISSGDHFIASVQGTSFCGIAAPGSGENVNGFPIEINGVVPSYQTAMSSTITVDNKLQGCSDAKSINIDLFISGGYTQSSDTLVITLPDGVSYDDGLICNTAGKCPTFVSATTIGNQEEVRFAYAAGLNGNIDFDFDISTIGRGACDLNSIINIKSENTLPGISCGAGTCPNVKAITGSTTLTTVLEKPDLGISFTTIQASGPVGNHTYDYDVLMINSGIATESDVILDFYCLNAAGDDIIGASVGKDTLTSTLATGGMTSLTGQFDCNCDPTQGIVVMVTPEYDNCYCDALNSMTDKSAGLAEIPHDKVSGVTLPVEISSFSLSENECEIIVNWTTSSETNSDYFKVERSFDGKNYQSVHTVPGAGFSNTRIDYQYIDEGRNASEIVYYRLVQFDIDNSQTIIGPKELHRIDCNELENELLIQPNVLSSGSNPPNIIFYNNIGYLTADIQVYALNGQLISEVLSVQLELDANVIAMEFENLSRGGYQVLLHVEGGKIYGNRFFVVDN